MATQKPQSSDPQGGHDKIVEKGKRQYLIVPRRGSQAARAGIQPLSTTVMKGYIANIPDLEVVRTLKSRKSVSTFSARADEADTAYVVKMDRNRAEVLKQTAPPHLIIEQDRFLDYGKAISRTLTEIPPRELRGTQGMRAVEIKFRVVGEGDQPLRTKVTLQGDAFAQEGMTDEKGEVTLKLHTAGDRPARSLFVSPTKDYWDRFLLAPDLSFKEVNVIRMLSLKNWLTGFPGSYKYGWGQKLMGLDQVPDTLTGKGVKIAIIDSGADSKHPLLCHLGLGMDMTNNRDAKSWMQDIVGHGSHCAGIITGRSCQGIAFRGFAPEAEIYIFKIFPGGSFSSLLEALDECMALDIDIINMSLGSDQISQAVEQKLEECVHDGIACIVAAGNSGGPVQYPASSPNVLAVSAIGREKEFPSESWDARTIVENLRTADGVFSPSFTCFGPQIGVCGPGVAIVSTVPESGFEAQSGTSMAAPHITGFAALVLAHHPAFSGPLKARGPQRVAGLFTLIKSACAPLPLGPERTGAGLPKFDSILQVLTSNVAATAGASGAAKADTTTTPAGTPTPSTQPAPSTAPAVGLDPNTLQNVIVPQLFQMIVQQYGMPFLLASLSTPGSELNMVLAELQRLAAMNVQPASAAPATGFPPAQQGFPKGDVSQLLKSLGSALGQNFQVVPRDGSSQTSPGVSWNR